MTAHKELIMQRMKGSFPVRNNFFGYFPGKPFTFAFLKNSYSSTVLKK